MWSAPSSKDKRKSGAGDYLYSGTATHNSTVVQQGRWAANGSQGALTIEATGTVSALGRREAMTGCQRKRKP